MDPTIARLRMGAALAGTELRPPGLPPAALLFVRRIASLPQGGMPLGPDAQRPSAAWESAFVSALEQALRHAARPALEAVPAAAEAVLFADRAELLACLARDALDGTAMACWWWRSALANAASGLDGAIRAWCDEPRHVPAALELLAAWSLAPAFVAALPAAVAGELTAGLARVFALPEPGRAPVAEERIDAGPWVEIPTLAATTPAPWSELVPEAGDLALDAGRRVLLGLALALRRAPTLSRTPAFARAVRAWKAGQAAGEPRRPPPAKDPPRGSQGVSTPRKTVAEGKRGQAAEDRPPDRPRDGPRAAPSTHPRSLPRDARAAVRAEPAVLRPPARAPIAGPDGRSGPATPRAPAVLRPPARAPIAGPDGRSGPATPRAPAGQAYRAPASDAGAEPEPLPLAPPPAAPPPAHREPAVAPPAPPPPAPPPSAPPEAAALVEHEPPAPAPARRATGHQAMHMPAPGPGERPVDTGLGGLFYLLNLALQLDLYGDFTRPCDPGIGLSPWDLVELLGLRLLGERPDDQVWKLLASLAGRQAGPPPGSGYRPPPAWRVLPSWLEPLDASGTWSWSAAGGVLRVVHPAGFAAIAVPRTAESPAAQLRRELDRYARLARRAAPRGAAPAAVRVRGELARLASSAGAPVRAALPREPVRPLPRWTARLAAYTDARLRRALALEPDAPIDEALIRRRARVFASATHVDIVLRLAELPIHVRIAGLDRTPGWIPATGRFIAFHFE
jgi:hypothetical protein